MRPACTTEPGSVPKCSQNTNNKTQVYEDTASLDRRGSAVLPGLHSTGFVSNASDYLVMGALLGICPLRHVQLLHGDTIIYKAHASDPQNWEWRDVQWLRALAEDPGSALSTHGRQLTTTCNSSCRGSNTLLWPLWVRHTCCTHTCRQTYT